MAPLPNNSLDHFTHPGHPLTAVDNHEHEYLCDGCKAPGTGIRYRCNSCDFDLHDYCGTCPRVLSSFMHKNHALTLVNHARQVNRVCSVCSDSVEGLFYKCEDCDFNVHPLCTQLPEILQHDLHKIHLLGLESSEVAGFCAVCRGLCKSWRYRCGVCSFDIHLECVLVPSMENNDARVTRRGYSVFNRGIPFQPPPYRFCSCGLGYYHPLDQGLMFITIILCIRIILCRRMW